MNQQIYGWVAGITTLMSMLAFIGVVAYCYSGRRRSDFDATARLPLEEDAGRITGAEP
jgi:cytochrome c oxidase cbb3-type subunit 4